MKKLLLLAVLSLFVTGCVGGPKATFWDTQHDQHFTPLDGSRSEMAHRGAGIMAFSASMTLYAAGVQPEIAAPVGAAVTVLAEQHMHRRTHGAHGMTPSEYKWIAVGAVSSYAVEKGFQHLGWHSPLRWEW